MLKRKIEKQLTNYFLHGDKILIVDGARQVGKTYIIRETANKYFKNYIEINLKDDFESLKEFKNVKDVTSFYFQVSSRYGEKLGSKEDTIIFLDEIQVYPHLVTLLKPLYYDGRYKIVCSGSLLGITLKHTFIPMGAIDEIKMYPLDLEEFLLNSGVGEDVILYLKGCYINKTEVYDGVHKRILSLFKQYLICGGLPGPASSLIEKQNIAEVREIQNKILSYYKDDASQYDQVHNLKIRRIYDSLSSYMDNKVHRIIYKNIDNDKNDNFETYADEFDYLICSGCALKVNAVANPHFPLIESSSKDLIKLYYNDVGLLSNILFKNNISAILNKDKDINLGSLYETVIAMELKAHDHDLYYFDSKKVGEVDFLINDYDSLNILPIEVKSGNDVYNFRAIPKLVKEPYNLPKGIILSNLNKVEMKDNLLTLPIYMCMFL